jgi:hypothetical protein
MPAIAASNFSCIQRREKTGEGEHGVAGFQTHCLRHRVSEVELEAHLVHRLHAWRRRRIGGAEGELTGIHEAGWRLDRTVVGVGSAGEKQRSECD